MISRSVAQMATASILTRTSPLRGTGVRLLLRTRVSGSPRTHACIVSGIGKSALVRTPGGEYITNPTQTLRFTPRLGSTLEQGFPAQYPVSILWRDRVIITNMVTDAVSSVTSVATA